MGKLTKIIIGIAIAGIVAINVLKEPAPALDPQATADIEDIKRAYTVCKMAFEKTAHDPKSIEWIRDERQAGFLKNKDGSLNRDIIANMQPVRAKNKFGALIRAHAICEAHRSGDTWTVFSIHTSDN